MWLKKIRDQRAKKKKDNGEKTKEKANREKGGEGGRKASTGDENG